MILKVSIDNLKKKLLAFVAGRKMPNNHQLNVAVRFEYSKNIRRVEQCHIITWIIRSIYGERGVRICILNLYRQRFDSPTKSSWKKNCFRHGYVYYPRTECFSFRRHSNLIIFLQFSISHFYRRRIRIRDLRCRWHQKSRCIRSWRHFAGT